MASLDTPQLLLILVGATLMTAITLRAIAQSSFSVVAEAVQTRRSREEKRRADNAEAEAAGRAAALEPLLLNPDGTIEEPIIAMVEQQ